MADAPTPGGDIGDGEDFEEPEENDEGLDGGIDKEPAADLNLALCDDDIDDDDEEDDDDEALMKARKLLQ